MSIGAALPLDVRLEFGHAAVEAVCDDVHADVLHVKGLALDPSLAFRGRDTSDVDVLCRPAHVALLLAGLHERGWETVSGFAASSAFAHAATLRHRHWGYLDLHRLIPGVGADPGRAFELLWARRERVLLAGHACSTPDLDAQALVLLLHAARSHGWPKARADIAQVWDAAAPGRRAGIRRWADELEARLPLAAAIGELDGYRGHPEHDLWAVLSQGGTRMQEWRARVRAARGLRAKVGVLVRSTTVSADHLGLLLGHRPSRGELAVEFVARPVRGVREELARRRAARIRRRRPRA